MKNITAMMITLAMLLSMTACDEGTNTPVNTTAETTAETTEVTAEETTEVTAEETTEVTAEETTEVTASETVAEPTAPEFDINSEECMMYRLLDMTVAEIEAEFGELTLYGIIAGGTPCYKLSEYGILLYFDKYSDDFNEPLPRDLCPNFVETDGYTEIIYPGIYVGMDSKELIDMIGIDWLQFSMGEILGGHVSQHYVDDRTIMVRWLLPEDVTLNIESTAFYGDNSEYYALLGEVVLKMKTGEIRGEVLDICV